MITMAVCAHLSNAELKISTDTVQAAYIHVVHSLYRMKCAFIMCELIVRDLR